MTARLAALREVTQRPDILGVAIAMLVYVGTMAIVVPSLNDPDHIDHITIDNPHPWLANIDISDGHKQSWVGLGRVDRESERAFHEILDQGDHWTIRFSYAGHHVETQLIRPQLERDDWHLVIPDDFANKLRRADVPETPE